MKYRASKNSNGSWVFFNNKDQLPVGTVSEDGKKFYVAHYNGMTIDHELMCAITEFMSFLRREYFEIKNELIEVVDLPSFKINKQRLEIEVGKK